ncbi:hypothetical protein BDK51DRAFT_30854 [Blyttiomyces helicus]|uniref:Uncharacterized protein n=1 Tax=Blyttiomyces helicus TaxID=388810 RepID=A0A4V1IQG8_9FUNG|nr:hypothetical protein BDK51DRAFT_30854 [Blyttiomyces helicus]|eukprot:RKO86507.1 hypothetical protein BDK51DRAFT_30854 [Blyttiomyces helicus]
MPAADPDPDVSVPTPGPEPDIVAAVAGPAQNILVVAAGPAPGRLAVVKVLHEKSPEVVFTEAAINGAAAISLEVVRFLHESRTEGCTRRAMNEAADAPLLDVVRFLHEHRSTWYTTKAMDFAVQHWVYVTDLDRADTDVYRKPDPDRGAKRAAIAQAYKDDARALAGRLEVRDSAELRYDNGNGAERLARFEGKAKRFEEVIVVLATPQGRSPEALVATCFAGCVDIVRLVLGTNPA